MSSSDMWQPEQPSSQQVASLALVIAQAPSCIAKRPTAALLRVISSTA